MQVYAFLHSHYPKYIDNVSESISMKSSSSLLDKLLSLFCDKITSKNSRGFHWTASFELTVEKLKCFLVNWKSQPVAVRKNNATDNYYPSCCTKI